MWDILLVPEEVEKALVGSTLSTKTMRLQTEYMGTRKTWITLHEVPMYITEDHLGAFFADYSPVDYSPVVERTLNIATSDFEV